MSVQRMTVRCLLLFCVVTAVSCQQPSSDPLCGVWHYIADPPVTVPKEFSWGSGEIVVNGSIEIDSCAAEPWIFIGGIGGPFAITRLEEAETGRFLLEFYFERGDMHVSYSVVLHDNGTITFRSEDDITFIREDREFYRISGPSN